MVSIVPELSARPCETGKGSILTSDSDPGTPRRGGKSRSRSRKIKGSVHKVDPDHSDRRSNTSLPTMLEPRPSPLSVTPDWRFKQTLKPELEQRTSTAPDADLRQVLRPTTSVSSAARKAAAGTGSAHTEASSIKQLHHQDWTRTAARGEEA